MFKRLRQWIETLRVYEVTSCQSNMGNFRVCVVNKKGVGKIVRTIAPLQAGQKVKIDRAGLVRVVRS